MKPYFAPQETCDVRLSPLVRLLAALLAAFCLPALAPGLASAMGFGAPVLKSRLNEPLNLVVPLELSEGESLSRVSVSLASKREYRDLGLEPPAHRAAIRISLEKDRRGRPQVKLDSEGPVADPVLSLLIKARSGRMTYFKHFEVMLDPPPSEKPAPGGLAATVVRAAASPAPGIAPGAAPEETSPVRSLPADAPPIVTVRSSWARADRYGPVRAGDSLSVIAYRLRKDKRYSNRQVTLALYDKNPNAFIHGDINRLKPGAWLVTPTAEEVERHGGPAAMARLEALIRQGKAKEPPAPKAKPKPKPTATTAAPPPSKPETRPASQPPAGASGPQGFTGEVRLGDREAIEAAIRAAREARANEVDARLQRLMAQAEESRQRLKRMDRTLDLMERYTHTLEKEVAELRALVKRNSRLVSPAWFWAFVALLLADIVAAVWLTRRLKALEASRAAAPLDAPREREPTTAPASSPEPEPASEPAPAADPPEPAGAPHPSASDPEEDIYIAPGAIAATPPTPPAPKEREDEARIRELVNRIEEDLHWNRLDEAERRLDELAELAPKHLRGMAMRAELLLRRGETEACRELVGRAHEELTPRYWKLFSGILSPAAWHAWHDGPNAAHALLAAREEETPAQPEPANADEASEPNVLELDLSDDEAPAVPDAPADAEEGDDDSDAGFSRTVIIRPKNMEQD